MTKALIRDPWSRNRLIRDSICRAIHHKMQLDPTVYLLGEGAHMKVHFDAPDIEHDFPSRILTLPISEDGNSNFAVGMALGGLIPIVDVISSDFLYRTMDSICNTMAKLGTVQSPKTMIVRAEFLTGGPTSGQRIEAMFTHVPGLKIAIPSNPIDAYEMMKSALSSKNVTIFFEDRMIKDAWFAEPTNLPLTPVDELGITSRGDEATVVSYGITHALAARALQGKPCMLFDLRTLVPLKISAIIDSVGDTGKLLVIEPDAKFMGIGSEIVAQVTERYSGVGWLKRYWCLKRLGGPRSVIPASRELHDLMIPTEADILRAYEELPL